MYDFVIWVGGLVYYIDPFSLHLLQLFKNLELYNLVYFLGVITLLVPRSVPPTLTLELLEALCPCSNHNRNSSGETELVTPMAPVGWNSQ